MGNSALIVFGSNPGRRHQHCGGGVTPAEEVEGGEGEGDLEREECLKVRNSSSGGPSNVPWKIKKDSAEHIKLRVWKITRTKIKTNKSLVCNSTAV